MQKIADTYSADAALDSPLTAGQLNRLHDEAASLVRLLRCPENGARFDRIIDACNALRYACLNTHETPPGAAPQHVDGQIVDAEFPGTPTVAECIAQLDTWNGHLEVAIDRQALAQLGQHANDDPFVVGLAPAGRA